MTLLELLEDIDDKLRIVSGEDSFMEGTEKHRAVKDARDMCFQAKMFAQRLQASLNLIPSDVLISSGNPHLILGPKIQANERITLSGFDVHTDTSGDA